MMSEILPFVLVQLFIFPFFSSTRTKKIYYLMWSDKNVKSHFHFFSLSFFAFLSSFSFSFPSFSFVCHICLCVFELMCLCYTWSQCHGIFDITFYINSKWNVYTFSLYLPYFLSYFFLFSHFPDFLYLFIVLTRNDSMSLAI